MLSHFNLRRMSQLGASLRRAGEGARCTEEVSAAVVRRLFAFLRNERTGQPDCALVRLYGSLAYDGLPGSVQRFVDDVLGGPPTTPRVRCLTLLATAGERPEWNDRRRSVAHRAIPLPSEDFVERFPMVAQMLAQLGLDTRLVVHLDPETMVDQAQRSYNIFHVSEAVGSPFIPAQDDFVIPFGIRSVLGFGGVLPSGRLFATLLFCKVAVPRETAELFAPVALAVKLALLPFDDGPVFQGED